MARSLKHERRLLSADELSIVEKTHHPALGLLPDEDLRSCSRVAGPRANDRCAPAPGAARQSGPKGRACSDRR
ncbi:MAG: hypothetical protein USCAAHI_02216 [Beijerinckiaceae bacterium]|nr:MAG: hypothetical protein USCAAHI_02216 [Beijerinckiaceae bacterium]